MSKTQSFQGYDFLDFGASKGGSIELAKELFGAGRGLGLDLSPEKVAIMREAGYECRKGDCTTLDVADDSVRFVVMSHFLEHLPGPEDVRAAVDTGARVARDFLYIQGPFFDRDHYLGDLNLKLYWSDWSGHKCHVTTEMLCKVLASLGLSSAVFMVRKLIKDSSHPAVHPFDSPRNQHAYDSCVHPPKPLVRFDREIYSEIICLVRLRPLADWDRLLERIQELRRARISPEPAVPFPEHKARVAG